MQIEPKVSLKRWLVPVIVVLFSLLLVACNQEVAVPDLIQAAPTYELDPIFSEIYRALGGTTVLGVPIGDSYDNGVMRCQYTENVQLCFDTTKEDISGYILGPVGDEQNNKSETNPPTQETDQKVVEGYTIYPEFVGLFNSMFGERFTGLPVSEPFYDLENSRVVQYFTNVAMAYDMRAPEKGPYLLPLGVADCGEACAHGNEPPESAILETQEPGTPFVDVMERAGGKGLTGEALTKPFDMDGFRYQIFKNVVIYVPLDDFSKGGLYPAARPMDMYQSEPVTKQYDQKQGMTFYPITGKGDKGFHVPLEFDAFVMEHGGQTLSGQPIAEVVQYEDGAYRQCFEAYCLDYDIQEPPEQRVRVYPLGMHYLQKLLSEGVVDSAVIEDTYVTSDTVRLLVMEEKSQVFADESQVIYMAVMRNDFKTPVVGVSGNLTVVLPDGTTIQQHFQPTSKEGLSAISLPPMPDLKSGEVIGYRVCLELPQGSEEVCAGDGYLIWNSLP